MHEWIMIITSLCTAYNELYPKKLSLLPLSARCSVFSASQALGEWEKNRVKEKLQRVTRLCAIEEWANERARSETGGRFIGDGNPLTRYDSSEWEKFSVWSWVRRN